MGLLDHYESCPLLQYPKAPKTATRPQWAPMGPIVPKNAKTEATRSLPIIYGDMTLYGRFATHTSGSFRKYVHVLPTLADLVLAP
jgi:hypothetical protein